MAGYVVRHWRGQLGPGVTWWINTVAVTVGLWWLVPRAAAASGLGAPTAAAFGGAVALQFLQLGAVPLWQMVGLWRCGYHCAQGPGHWPAGRTLQVAAFLFTLLVAMRGLVFAAETAIGARVAFALGPYSYQVRLHPSGRAIDVQGGLGYGVAAAVEALLARHPGVRRIRLDSGGGALSEATQLRSLILARDLDTYAARECSSACVSAFAGGRFRYLKRGARMGFHLPRNWESFSANPVARSYQAELRYLHERGLPDWFLARWIRSGQRFWYPTERQLLASGLVTTLLGTPPATGSRPP